MRILRCSIVLLAWLAAAPAPAGEIPGLPPQLPPYLERDFELAFSNDFLGRGGTTDDFRTQQVIVSTKLAKRWIAIFDHSILTLDDGNNAGRKDQLSGSIGYEFISRTQPDRTDTTVMGVGIRRAGDLDGERMQNGFHRLIGSSIEDLPYVRGDDTAGTVWFDTSHYRALREAGEGGLLPGWQRGIWLRASSLATTDGQWDNAAAVFAVARRASVDVWLGVRGDWRSGYRRPVLRETAEAEQDAAVVVGARFGPLVIETVQQFRNNASYGQLRIVSSGHRAISFTDHETRFGLVIGFTLPDVKFNVAGRYPGLFARAQNSAWQKSLVVGASYGEPQYGNNNRLYQRDIQLDAGLELERPWTAESDWLSLYVRTSAGWRQQSLIAVGDAREERSASVGRAVLTMGAGIRADASGAGKHWRLYIQTGLVGILPVTEARLEIDERAYRVQKATLNLLLGFTLEFR